MKYDTKKRRAAYLANQEREKRNRRERYAENADAEKQRERNRYHTDADYRAAKIKAVKKRRKLLHKSIAIKNKNKSKKT